MTTSSGVHVVNEGTNDVAIVLPDRTVSGLHLCDTCVTILFGAFRSVPGAGVLPGPPAVTGPCDLCRYTTALSGLLDRGPR